MAASKTALEIPGFDWYDSMPASPAVRAGEMVFVSGQVGAGPTGRVLSPNDVGAQAREALDSLERVLEHAGGSLADVVDLMSFHRDIRTIDAVFDAARGRFGEGYPAWTPVGMTGSYRPDIELSIRAIADLGEEAKQTFTPEGAAWMERYPMSAGCRKGSLLFISGQSGLGGDAGDPAPGDPAAHARAAYARAAEIVEAAGGTMDDIVDICSFHLDPRGMVPCERTHMEVWEGTEPPDAPVWTAIGVPSLLLPGMLSQYRFIADFSDGPRIGRVSAGIHWKDTPNAGASRKAGGRLIGIAGEVSSDGEGNVIAPGDTLGQARYAFNRIREVIEMHGASMDDVVEVTSFHKDHRAWEIVMEAGREYFEADRGPAWTPCGVTGLWNPGYLHEIYALAVV